ncbi:helix-turn-helix domain-containing protein [Rhodococcus hoagii]|nr:helix-turn-helix domain-containing protein [Prescottella equi]
MPPTQTEWDDWEKAAVRQLGGALRSARELAGLSQRQLAENAGIDRGQIANLEGGKDGVPRVSELPRWESSCASRPPLMCRPFP